MKLKSNCDDSLQLTSLSKRELANNISQETGFTQMQVAEIVQMTLDGIIKALQEGRQVEFREFGVFEIKERKARVGRNPKKPDIPITIPGRMAIKFKPGKRMRDILAAADKST